MAVVRNLLVRCGADFSELQKEMQKASKFMNKAGQDIADAGKKMTLGITVPLLSIGAVGIKTASDLKEVQNVVDTAFGESAKSVDAWAKTAIESYGLSELQAKKFAGTTRALVGSMGLSASEADNMSMSISGLAGDMASFYNLDPTEAFDKLRSGISGETEPLKALGINMSVANMEAYALTQGINKSWKEMSAAEQTTLRYGFIMDATKMAQGDFAKTNTGFANSWRVVSEQLKSVAAQIAGALLPYIEKFLGKVREMLTYLQSLTPEMQKKILLFAGIAASIGPLLFIIGKMLVLGGAIAKWGAGVSLAMKGVAAGTKGVGAIMTAVFGPAGIVLLVIAGIALVVGGLMWLWKNNEDFRNFIINTWNRIVAFMLPILNTIKDYLINTWNNIVAFMIPVLAFIKDYLITTWNTIWNNLKPILIALKDIIVKTFTYVWTTLQPIVESIKNMLGAAWEFIVVFAKVIFEGLKIYFKVYFEIIKAIVSTFVSAVSWIWTNFGDIITRVFQTAWDTVVGVFNGVVRTLTGIFNVLTGLLTGNWSKCWQGMKDIVGGIWGGIVAMVKGGINMLISSLNYFIRGLSKVKVPKWVPGVGGMGIDIPEIPYLAKGGITTGPTLAMIGEGKEDEAVLPLSKLEALINVNKSDDNGSNNKNQNINIDKFIVNDKGDQDRTLNQLQFLAAL